ncbi:MAG: hypothetical protein LBR26_17285 [Prevotella sp.]|jgi:hypothetical protein|nr:hypothetical protein [Prevotella sp.]
MKTIIKFGLYILTGLLVCSCKSSIPSAQVNYLSERDGSINVRSVGVGKTKDAAKANAEINGIDVLLFRGLPESSQKTPLLGYNESEIRKQYDNYFKQMYENKRYLTFVMSSQPVSDYSKERVSVEVKINLRALRSDLEGQGLIRKFGY